MHPLSQSNLEMSEADFRAIADIAYKEAGLVFLPEKASLVRSRINRRLRKLRFNSFAEYTAFVTSDQGRDERRAMISSLTTNISNFFANPTISIFCVKKLFRLFWAGHVPVAVYVSGRLDAQQVKKHILWP